MIPETERPRGILSPADRALLRGETDYKNRQQYSTRYQDVRERIANGLLDFDLIAYSLRDRDRKRIFSNISEQSGYNNANIHENIENLFYWVYLGLKEQGYDIERILEKAIKHAEKDFALMYRREYIDANLQLDIDVEQSEDISDLINSLENGEPVKSDRVYNLLSYPGSIPIDISKLDTVNVWFRSSYVDGEKAVLETLFSEFLGVDVEINDIEYRADPVGPTQNRASTDPDRPHEDPSEVKNYRSSESLFEDPHDSDHHLSENQEGSDTQKQEYSEQESIQDTFFEEQFKEADPTPTICKIAAERKECDIPVQSATQESVINLMDRIQDRVVSTVEVADALGCSIDAAQYALSQVAIEGHIQRSAVTDNDGDQLSIWYLPGD